MMIALLPWNFRCSLTRDEPLPRAGPLAPIEKLDLFPARQIQRRNASTKTPTMVYGPSIIPHNSSPSDIGMELKEVLTTHGHRTSSMHDLESPSFHEADTQWLS
jgi:hypothetical protein